MTSADILLKMSTHTLAYGWKPTPDTESFVKLLCRMSSDYLLDKISEMRFDLEESIKQTASHIKEYLEKQYGNEAALRGYGDNDIFLISSIDCDNEADFLGECQNILDASREDYSLCEYGIADAVSVYPRRAVKIASIFEKHIQPFLKTNFLDEANQ